MKKKLKNTIFVALFLVSVLFVQIVQASTVTIEAQKQDFKVETNTASFIGNVRVKYENIRIFSPVASLVANAKGEPDKAIFSEGARAKMTREGSTGDLTADQITLNLASNELIAQGNTFTKIKRKAPGLITVKADEQQFNNKTQEVKAKGNIVIHYKDSVISGDNATLTNDQQGKPVKAIISGNARFVRGVSTVRAGSIAMDLNSTNINASGGVNTVTTLKGAGRVTMRSSSQVYNKAANTVTGTGSVKMSYQDYIATGPKAVLYLSGKNSLKEIIFTGRSQIHDAMRKVTADKIKVTVDPKNFYAEGNVKTQFKQVNKQSKPAPKATKEPEKPALKPAVKEEEMLKPEAKSNTNVEKSSEKNISKEINQPENKETQE